MKRKHPHILADWQAVADSMLKEGLTELRPAKQQKHPQYWVIETLRPDISPDWTMASETMASGNGKDAGRKITPRRMETAINILKSHIARHHGFPIERAEVSYRVRNLRTGEIIPWEAIGSYGAE